MKRWSDLRPSTKRRYSKLGVTPQKYNAWALNPALRKRVRASGGKRHDYLKIPAPKPRVKRAPRPDIELIREQRERQKRDNTRRKLFPLFERRNDVIAPDKPKNPRSLEKFTFRHLPNDLVDAIGERFDATGFDGTEDDDALDIEWDAYVDMVDEYGDDDKHSYKKPWYN